MPNPIGIRVTVKPTNAIGTITAYTFGPNGLPQYTILMDDASTLEKIDSYLIRETNE